MTRKSLIVVAFALALVPFVAAHPVSLPSDPGACNPARFDHHWVAGTSYTADVVFVSSSQQGAVALADSCATIDNEGDFGVGGGFLPAGHHEPREGVCVTDHVTGAPVQFFVGTATGGVITSTSPTFVTCGKAFTAGGVPMSPGTDGGWWVFVVTDVNVDGNQQNLSASASTPAAGHICSAPVFAC